MDNDRATDMLRGSLRVMDKKDIPRLLDIQTEGELFWDRKRFSSELQNPLSHNMVALAGDIIVGFASVWIVAGVAEIHNIFVASAYRNRGVAKEMLLAIASVATNSGAGCLSLEVDNRNLAARRLYHSLGFKKVGLRENYYKDGGAAIMMDKVLS